MGSNFTDFGDLVLLIGDYHIPHRAAEMPACFQELLNTDKIRHVLCTGNIGCAEVLEQLRCLTGSIHIVQGDMDCAFDFPEYKVIQIGEFKVGLIHGHQIIPWSETKGLLGWQRRLDCDILIYGHSHQNLMSEVAGKYFINPGSVTGAFHPSSIDVVPSFMLMAIRGANVALYVYEEKEGKANVVMSEFKKLTPTAAAP